MILQLSQGQSTIIDDEDWPRVSALGWYAIQTKKGIWRAVASVPGTRGQRKILLHRFLMNDPKGVQVDHINRNPLDNRKENLRLGSAPENQQNTLARGGASKFKGVSWFSRRGRWRVAFNWRGKTHFVGYFDDEIEAAKAYDVAAYAVAGEWAVLNFPDCPRCPR